VVIEETDVFPRLNSIPYVADGLPGIYFQKSAHALSLNQKERQSSRLFLYGQTVDPITIDTIGAYTVVIFQLQPAAIKTLFGVDAHELTDGCIDYQQFTGQEGRDLLNRLMDEDDADRQIALIKSSLLNLLAKKQVETDSAMFYATDSILSTGGNIALKSLQDQLNVTERTFQRRFLQHVGVSPVQFKGIVRFHQALNCMERRSDDLAQIAYKHGFSDQSHFIRVFKTFTGKTPTEYLRLMSK
jgi:AraC-like DNA-binding protein